MFAVGNISNTGIERFYDFWICLGIFNKTHIKITETEKKKIKEREREKD